MLVNSPGQGAHLSPASGWHISVDIILDLPYGQWQISDGNIPPLQRRQDSHDACPRAQFDHLLVSKIHVLTLEIVTQAQSLWGVCGHLGTETRQE